MAEKTSANQLDSVLEGFFKKLPPLPANAIDGLVIITPWLALIFGIIGVLGAISAFGVLSVLAPFAALGGGVPRVGLGMLSTVGWLVTSVLMLLAFPGLNAKKSGGWNLLFWGEVVNVVVSVIAVSIGSVIGALIAFYLLYQIKPRYK